MRADHQFLMLVCYQSSAWEGIQFTNVGMFLYRENGDSREIARFYGKIQELVKICFLQFSISASHTLG